MTSPLGLLDRPVRSAAPARQTNERHDTKTCADRQRLEANPEQEIPGLWDRRQPVSQGPEALTTTELS